MTETSRPRAATSGDMAAVRALLGASGLPLAGLKHTQLWLLETDGTLAGVGGFERYGDLALLRSLAVVSAHRGRGLGGALLQHLLRKLQAEGVVAAYGLTTTVPEWLLRLAFHEVTRNDLPTAILNSEQLRGACPVSARVFKKALDQPTA